MSELLKEDYRLDHKAAQTAKLNPDLKTQAKELTVKLSPINCSSSLFSCTSLKNKNGYLLSLQWLPPAQRNYGRICFSDNRDSNGGEKGCWGVMDESPT